MKTVFTVVVVFGLGISVGYWWGKGASLSQPRETSGVAQIPLEGGQKGVDVTDPTLPLSKRGTGEGVQSVSRARVEAPEPEVEDTRPESTKNQRRLPSLDQVSEKWEVREFLKAAKEQNFFDVLKGSRPIQSPSPLVERLNGHFLGEVTLADERWEMEMDARLRVEGKKLQGQSRITLSKEGRVFSDQDGRGTLDEYQTPPSGEGLVVRASPDSYFHLFYVPRRDAFVGHFYKMKRPGEYEARGRVWLDRG